VARLAGRPRDIIRAVDSLFSDFPMLWRSLTLLAVITPLLLLNRRRSPLWIVSTALTLASAVFVVAFREFRFGYFVPVAAVAALGCWIQEAQEHVSIRARRVVRPAAAAGVALALALAAPLGLRRFLDQRRYYELVTPRALTALEWMREHVPEGDVVAVHDVRGVPYGWWVEGLSERAALSGSHLQWLNFEDERRRARLANALFQSTSFPNAGTLARARAMDVDVIFALKSWPRFKGPQLAKLRRELPASVMYENADVVVLDTRAGAIPSLDQQ
jgi:hypothetical protein